jgi:hypothetical protein
MRLIDYTPNVIPLLVLTELQKNANTFLSVEDLLERINPMLMGRDRIDRRSIYKAIDLIDCLGFYLLEQRYVRNNKKIVRMVTE